MLYRKDYTLLIGCFWFIVSSVSAQDQKIADSLALIYQQNTLTDTAKLELLRNLSFNETRDLNKGLKYAEELIDLSEKIGRDDYLRKAYFLKGTKKRQLGNLEEALDAYIKSAEVARKSHHLNSEAEAYSAIADAYAVADNATNASQYYNQAISILRRSKSKTQDDSINLASVILNAGDAFRRFGHYDSALLYSNEANVIFDKFNYQIGIGYCMGNIGMVYTKTGKYDLAEKNLTAAIKILDGTEDSDPICAYLLSMADVYLHKGDTLAALGYTLKSFHLAEEHKLKERIRDASFKLSELYEQTGKDHESLKYFKNYIVYRDSINNTAAERRMADLRYEFEMAKNRKEVEVLNQQKLSLGIILGLSIIILGILFKNNQNKQKAYKILHLQKQETDMQKAKAEGALMELQLTQKQLIQTAKMASLGELTAGIAHEIQNPLNFVNNFSDVNTDLIEELRNELLADRKPEAILLAEEIKNNEEKIKQHGRRADGIVKGMLQHARARTGKKEPTDINKLADEYLRLSYQGMRAKDKSFTATIETHFDDTVSTINVVPQDLGRVLLNLFNNAFYAVNEKSRQSNGNFRPLVTVTTKKVNDTVELSIKDNGTGIPQKLFDKIFQPFFTTKPTGQGTGLGLSLSYDIVKAHGGELNVQTMEGEFTEFIVQLPAKNQNGASI